MINMQHESLATNLNLGWLSCILIIFHHLNPKLILHCSPAEITFFELRSSSMWFQISVLFGDTGEMLNECTARKNILQMHRPDDSFPQIRERLAPTVITAKEKEKSSSIYIKRHFNNHCLSLLHRILSKYETNTQKGPGKKGGLVFLIG